MSLTPFDRRSGSWRDTQEREEKTVRVKREHDEAFGQDGVDYDDVLWTGTRPVRMRAFGELIG